MTTRGEEEIRRRMENEARLQREYERERDGLTVIKQTIVQARCVRCNHTRPYREGDENRPCPACTLQSHYTHRRPMPDARWRR